MMRVNMLSFQNICNGEKIKKKYSCFQKKICYFWLDSKKRFIINSKEINITDNVVRVSSLRYLETRFECNSGTSIFSRCRFLSSMIATRCLVALFTIVCQVKFLNNRVNVLFLWSVCSQLEIVIIFVLIWHCSLIVHLQKQDIQIL